MRVIRGLAALTVLLAGLIVLPWSLVVLTIDLTAELAMWSDPTALLSTGDPVIILLTLLLLGAWMAWLVFAIGVIAEVLALASGHTIVLRLPGVGSVQRFATGLLVSVAAMVTTAQASSADPAPPPPSADVPVQANAQAGPSPRQPTPATLPVADDSPAEGRVGTPDSLRPARVHVVEREDDLWSLAQHYYGRGSDWRRIAEANPDRLTGGPDRLDVGWRLIIPGVERLEKERGRKAAEQRTVVVRRGDTLSAIAERFYGTERRWPLIWNANRHQLDDPDELTIGMRLVVPDRERRKDGVRATDHADHADQQGAERRSTDERAESTDAGASTTSAPESTRVDSSPRGPSERTCSDGVPAPRPAESAAPSPTRTPADSAAPVPPAPPPGNVPDIPATDPPPDSTSTADDSAVIAAGLGSAGALLAAAVITGLALRRRHQLRNRPVGRRILHPGESAQRIETALGHRARPVSLRTLDLATRAISAHCHAEGAPLPALTVATITDHRLELHLLSSPVSLPPGFRAQDDLWVLDSGDVDELKKVPGLSEAVRPYPALVTLGFDAASRPVVADLENLRLLRLAADDPQDVGATLAAMALELSFSPWAEEMILTLVGTLPQLPDALGQHNVTSTDDVDLLLDRLEARADLQRELLGSETPGRRRVDPDLADPWAPEIVLFDQPLNDEREHRLHRLLTREPRVTMAAVLPGKAETAGGWTLRITPGGEGGPSVLQPLGLELRPQSLQPQAVQAVLELASVTGGDATASAPWWSHDGGTGTSADPDPPPGNVSYLEPGRPRRCSGWAEQSQRSRPQDEGELEMITGLGAGAGTVAQHPTLLLLGPVELIGAAGLSPSRAAQQCLEYCGWLLENPGATAHAMASALMVAEGTRRSNVSRLRSWLGSDESGRPYLPDAYSGRIRLSDVVSSDWQRLQILTAYGINRASTTALRTALELVRGAPLADAAPGQWHWAEELRTDMISAVRDLGVELADRALEDHDIDLARWAAGRALIAAPGDELLLVARIRTEHQAGHRSEVERLALHITAHARHIGFDLAPETVTVLQQVMEGRVRARMA